MKFTVTEFEYQHLIAAINSGIENESALADAYWDSLFNKPYGPTHGKALKRCAIWNRIKEKIIKQKKKEFSK